MAGDEVGGDVDIVAETGFPHDTQREPETPGFGAVALEGTRTVGEGELGKTAKLIVLAVIATMR